MVISAWWCALFSLHAARLSAQSILDSDGDGQGDEEEIRAGTDPNSAPSVFRILGWSAPPLAEGWRISWSSVPGRTYVLQRWNAADLGTRETSVWIEVATVTAASSQSSATDLTTDPMPQRYYRVVVLDRNPGPVLTVSPISVEPASARFEELVTLSVEVSSPVRVDEVVFFDGPAPLGSASRMDGDRWRLVWPVGFDRNGNHPLVARAMDETGRFAESQALHFLINIAAPQHKVSVGRVLVAGDTVQVNNGVSRLSGHVRLGGVSIQTGAPVTVDPIQGTVKGEGKVVVPGFGEVFSGAWVLDALSGWLTANTGPRPAALAAPEALSPVRLSRRVSIVPESLEVNVLDGAMRGSGRVNLQPPAGGLPPVELIGDYSYTPSQGTVTVTGSLKTAAIRGEGRAVVQAADGTMVWDGGVVLADGTLLDGARLAIKPGTGDAATWEVNGFRIGAGGAKVEIKGSVLSNGTLLADAEGPATPAAIRDDPDRFVPLGPGGVPLEGARLQMRADGSLPPFEYRPAGRSLLGRGHGLGLQFADGATWVEQGGGLALRFQQVKAGFGSASPMQFQGTFEWRGASPQSLVVGLVDVTRLATLFGTGAGLPVKLFGFPLILVAGTFDDGGIAGARFSAAATSLPLPPNGGDYPGFSIDLSNTSGIQIPFYGDLELPSLGGAGPIIRVLRSKPVWLRLFPDGSTSLDGRVQAILPGHGTIQADLSLADPRYSLELSASGVRVPALSSLVSVLPSVACVQADTPVAGEALDVAAECLTRFANAMRRFNAAAVAEGQSTAGDLGERSAPDLAEAATAVLDAWAYSRLVAPAVAPAAAVMENLLNAAGRSAAAAADLRAALSWRRSLERLRRSGSQMSEPAFEAALRETVGAAVRLAGRDGAVLTVRSLRDSLTVLLETEVLIQQSSRSVSDDRLRTAMIGLLRRFLGGYLDGLGVRAGEFGPGQNSTLLGLSLAETREALSQLVEVLRLAQLLGIDGDLNGVPSEEARVQLAAQWVRFVERSFDEAEAKEDFEAYCAAAEDHLELTAILQTGSIPEHAALQALRSGNSVAEQLQRIWGRHLQQSATQRLVRRRLAELRRLDTIQRRLGGAAAEAVEVFRQMHVKTEETLQWSLEDLETPGTTVEVLLEILEMGILHAHLRDRLGITESIPWEGPQRLGRVLTVLSNRGQAEQAWNQLDRATRLLLDEAAGLKTQNQGSRRRRYLVESQRLLESIRQIGNSLAPRLVPGLQVADMLLPGELRIDRASGTLVYDRAQQSLTGAFSGRVFLPRFALGLTVDRATISSDGSFDLRAYGSVVGPNADSPLFRFTVPESRPLEIRFQPNGEFKLAGAGRVDVNGMTFEAFLRHDDPNYAFGLSAQGLRFDLANSLRLEVPVLPDPGLLTTGMARNWNKYLRSLSASFAGLGALGATPDLREPGESPDFTPTALLSSADDLNAWVLSGIVNPAFAASARFDAITTNALSKFSIESSSLSNGGSTNELDRLNHLLSFMKEVCEGRTNSNPTVAQKYTQISEQKAFKESVVSVREGMEQVLTSRDPKVLSEVARVNALTTLYSQVMPCFQPDLDLASLAQTYSDFLGLSDEAIFAALGINRTTGDLDNSRLLEGLKEAQLRQAIQVIPLLNRSTELLGRPVPPAYHKALLHCLLELRKRLYAKVKEIAPDDKEVFLDKRTLPPVKSKKTRCQSGFSLRF